MKTFSGMDNTRSFVFEHGGVIGPNIFEKPGSFQLPTNSNRVERTPLSVPFQVPEEKGELFCNLCANKFAGEYAKGNLSRHKRQKHGDGEQSYTCQVAGCMKSFKRQDALLKHNRRSHPELGMSSPHTRR